MITVKVFFFFLVLNHLVKKPGKIQFVGLLKISRDSKMFLVNAGWRKRGSGMRNFSSLDRQRNIAQLLSVSQQKRKSYGYKENVTVFFLVLVPSFKKKKKKGLKTCLESRNSSERWPFLVAVWWPVYCCIPRASIGTGHKVIAEWMLVVWMNAFLVW